MTEPAAGLQLVPGVYANVPFADYLLDPCEAPSLTSSTAKTLLERSPLHAWYEHPRLGGNGGPRATRAMDTGTVIHAMLLGGGQDYVALPFDDWRKKEAQQKRDEARLAGLIPILERQLDACAEAAEHLCGVVPAGGENEVTTVWLHEGAVLCRGRIDSLFADGCLCYDLKTCDDAARAASGASIVGAGRDLEAAARLDALDTLFPAHAGRWRFRYVFAEIEPPYAAVEAELAGEFLALGRRKWGRACEVWTECLESNNWPGPLGGKTTVEAPQWAIERELEQQLARIPVGAGNAALGL